MKFITVKTYEELSRLAGNLIIAQVNLKPNCVLGLATGSSPLGTYARIIEAYKAGDVDFADVKSINLDEYVGLDGTNDQSYRYFMNTNLFQHINIDLNNTYVPDGCADDLQAACAEHDARIAELGVDMQLLGIGLDGHIGFNEPADEFVKPTNIITLDPSTIEANARFFKSIDDVPRQAITMGMGGIMSAKKILLIANGKKKEEIVKKAFFGPIDPHVPASILQLHPDVTVIYSEE